MGLYMDTALLMLVTEGTWSKIIQRIFDGDQVFILGMQWIPDYQATELMTVNEIF